MDEWFYESIRSYKTLQMYDLEMRPNHLIKINDISLCLAGTHTLLKRSEVMSLKLPKKLLLPPEEKGRCKGNDFDIISGGFFDAPIHKICVLFNQEKLLASFNGQTGLSVLSLGSTTSNVIKEDTKFLNDTSLNALNFAIKEGSTNVVASKTTQDPLIALDLGTGQISRTTCIPELHQETPGEVSCVYPSQPIILNSSTGCALVLDERTFSVSAIISKGGIRSHYVIAATTDNLVSVLSQSGQCELFDARSLSGPIISGNLNFPAYQNGDPKVVFLSKNRLSFSGVGSCVYVFETHGSEFRHVFTHRGHSYSDTNCSDGLVTDHLWLPLVAENFLVSCCDNGTLNCWEYKV